MAQTVANDMVKDKEKALKAAQNAKSKGGATIAEKIASEQERKANIQNAEQELAIWQAIASVPEVRQQAMAQAQAQAEAERIRQIKEAEEKAKAEAEALKAQQEADDRAKAEALNGVPDMVDDTPQAARERGFRRYNGHKYDRQEPIEHEQGKDVEIKFSDSNIVPGHVAVIDVANLQPSHITGVRNPLHFIDEAQPKERNDDASVFASRQIAAKIRPEEITTSVTAYTGAPTVNTRGEVIQGNNRSEALRLMWESEKAQAQKYKQYLIDHASEFGLTPEQIEAMEQPVLVNMVDVTDEQAIELGQFVAQDTESGGIERIKPKNAMQKMGDDMRVFANMLLRSADEEMSITALIDANGEQVLEWMSKKGYITATQYQSAFDTRGNITAEAKNDLKGIMYQSIFKGGSTQLEEMFNTLPAKAQKAILATAFRDFDSPNAERMIDEIQNSIRAYYALSLDKVFAEAKNAKDVRIAVEAWKRQTQMDDVSGEAYLPAEKFSNFALHLTTMYKGNTQKLIQGTFNQLFDLIQGTQEENLFEKPDNTPRTLAEAIKEVLNIDYNGQSGSNVLGVNPQTSQSGRQGSERDTASRERAESTEQSADSAGGIDGDSRGIRSESEDRASQSEENATEIKSSMSANEAIDFVADMELIADVAPEIDLTIENWDALFGESGTINTPIGEVKMGENQFAKLMRQGREGKLGMIKPTLENPHAIVEEASEAKEGDTTERASSYIFIRSFKKADGSRFYYFTSITVSKDGREVVVSSQEKSRNKILRLLQEGSVIWRTPKDATTSSAERQGLDYEQPNKAETAPKGSGITPQSTSSESKDTTSSQNNNEIEDKNVQPTIGEQIQAAEAEVNINPTEAQKEVSFSIREGNVASNNIATEVAVGMLKDAGVEVVEATDAMAEAVLAKGGVMMSMDSAPFYSNAKKAVLDIKQDKATPQQWVAMLKKNGGLKAGEDAWLGLESWLSGQTGSVTKQEIVDYIDEHAIEIEEVNYGESEVSQFEDSDIYNEWAELGGDEDAFNEMIERYGDDFEMAFLYDEGQLYVADEDAASFFIDKGAETINETRLSYTTEGLTDNREIALTVPTIEPYNQNDDIHFGDAGGGRAVAWVRFGETKITKRIPDETAKLGYRVAPVRVLVIDEIQSVRHQDGREKGYRNEEVIALENRINSLHEKMYGEGLAPEEYRELTRLREEQREIIINANPELKAESEKVKELEKEYEALKKDNQSKLDSEGVELARLQTLQEDARSIAEYDRIEKEIQDIKDAADKRKAELNEFFNVTIGNAYDKLHKGIRNDLSNQVYGVPVAPFEKNWHELAMKRMLRYAAENGYDKVAWTTGAQQAARYDMRQQVDNIQVEENNIEEFNDGTPIAKNITINTPRGNKIRYQADAEGNIRGGEYGGKNLKDVVGKELAEKIMQPGSFTIEEEGLAIGGEGMKGFYDKMLPSFVNKYTKKWGAKVGEVTMPSLEEGYQTMHSVDVTPQMKEDVMKGQPMFLRTPNGTVYGWTQGGKVFLTKEGMNAETPIHEYTHLWDKMVQQKNPELWNRGKGLLKQTPTWNEVVNDKNYANIAHDEDAVASEVHSRLSGENGAKVLEQMIKDARKDGAMAVAKAASITERIKEWVKDMFAALKETLSIEDFNNLTLRDLAEGVNPTEFVTEEGDMQFRAKRKSRALEIDESNLRQTKQEANSIIDKAVGIFVGGPKAAKAMRKQKEAERKALATEIYSKVLAGDFNPLTLQQIEKYINDVTPRNPFGNRISQRIPQEVERGVYGRESTSAIDLLFSRICESAVSAPRRFSEEGRREIEERKKEALKGWAIATGNWHTDLSEFTNDKEPFAQGTDSKVYTSKYGGYVIKASKGKPYGKRFRADIDNVALFNHIFPNSKYDIVGYGEIDGNFVRILRQPFVDFSQSDILTEEERVAYMAELGFTPLNKENTAFSNGDFVVADLQKANIVRDVTGNIRVIDADVKLHTTDTGGNYSYAPVENDIKIEEDSNDQDISFSIVDSVAEMVEDDVRFSVRESLSGTVERMADISNYFNGRTLSAEQQAVVDVYSGKSNNLPISINRADSNIKVVMRQGVEQKAGAKHSLFRHYGTNVGVITSEDIILIPEIFANGERVKKQHGNTTLYEYKQTINGVKYTVLTEVNNRGAEIFDDYYTDRSKVARSSNTQLSAQADSNLASQHKVTQNSANSNSEGEITRQGSGVISDEGVTMASDPVSKAIGEPRYGRGKKMREYAERQRRLMAQKVQEIAQKLKLDNVEIVTDASTLSRAVILNTQH